MEFAANKGEPMTIEAFIVFLVAMFAYALWELRTAPQRDDWE